MTQTSSSPGSEVASQLLAALSCFEERPALECAGSKWSYVQLKDEAEKIGRLIAAETSEPHPVVGIYATREPGTYAAILSCLMSGRTYVPLNPRYPTQRLLTMAQYAEVTCIIVNNSEHSGMQQLNDAAGLPVINLASSSSAEPVGLAADRPEPGAVNQSLQRESGLPGCAYIMFTSGSTGNPKGIAVSTSNLDAYLSSAAPLLGADHTSRFSQTFDLSFDLSVHDLLMSWTSGGCLVVASDSDRRSPAEYISNNRLTHWFSVPSLGRTAQLQGSLSPNSFPMLSSSLFCGEALSHSLAIRWSEAAPASSVENWYGPTEATIACARHVFSSQGRQQAADTTQVTQEQFVPIGRPFGDTTLEVLDDDLTPVRQGMSGQLTISGPQVTAGYLNSPERTGQQFLCDQETAGLRYLTGDRASQNCDGTLGFLGRLDSQIKVRGYRIELCEVERHVQRAAPSAEVVVLGWPTEPVSERLVCVLSGEAPNPTGLRASLDLVLPAEMVPTSYEKLDHLPLTAHGKVDREKIRTDLSLRYARRDTSTNLRPEAGVTVSCIDLLLCQLLQIVPGYDDHHWLSALTLFDAGLDSLGFVQLTGWMEQDLGLALEPNRIDELAELGAKDIAKWIDSRIDASLVDKDQLIATKVDRGLTSALAGPGATRSTGRSRHQTRPLDFIEQWPSMLASTTKPAALLIGSSGVFRGLSAQEFGEHSNTHGVPLQVYNLSFQGLGLTSMTDVCRFAASRFSLSAPPSNSLELCVYELDPTMLSVLPPPTVDLPAEFFNRGQSQTEHLAPSDRSAAGSEVGNWIAATSGDSAVRRRTRSVGPLPEATPRTQRPGLDEQDPPWVVAREKEICDIFKGNIDFDDTKIQEWLLAAEIMRSASNRFFVWIHPLRPTANASSSRCDVLVKLIETRLGPCVLDPDEYVVDDDRFTNINHVGSARGRTALTRQTWGQIVAKEASNA